VTQPAHSGESDITPTSSPAGHSRRTFLGATGAAVALAATGWTPAFRIPAASAASTLPVPPGFPAGIQLDQQAFQNWSEGITIEAAWTATPATPADVVTIVNWAHGAGYRVRPRGKGHNWSPLLLPNGADVTRVILVDLTPHLTALTTHAGPPATVTVQAGATVDTLTAALETAGYGLLECTAPGDLTVGGVLAVGAHGSGVPASGETRPAGGTYGSLSNLVLSLTAVVWNPTAGAYALHTFQRADADIGAFLVHLGRAFVTEVTLQVITNQRLRCQNWYDISAADLFGAPGSNSNTLDSYITTAGRVEAIWFPFTGPPWLKVWSVTPSKPLFSKEIDAPYPYTFANFINQQEADFVKAVVQGDVSGTPVFENAEMAIVGSGLIVTGTWDVWGWSRNSLLYVQPTTLRIVEGGWAVLTSRASVQRVLHEFYTHYQAVLTTYADAGQYPVNGPVEIRITGLDQPTDVVMPGAVQPALSAVRPRPDHPEWDTCVWLDIGTLPGTPAASQFYTDMETWIWANYTGAYATVRPEWSKAWAHTSTGAWTDRNVLANTIPNAFRAGQPTATGWDATVATLNRYDPARVFSNPFLDTLL
jgi:FAD/FMN-containing dehydrogenase